MASSLYSLLFLFAIFISATMAQNGSLILPIRKDPRTSQFYTTFEMGSRASTINVVINLGGRHLWFGCDNYTSTSIAPINCQSAECNLAGFGGCITCDGPTWPGCSDNLCAGYSSFNPFFADSIPSHGYHQDTLHSSRDLSQFIFSCVPNDFVSGLGGGAVGILGLGMSRISIPKQTADKLNLPAKFWICPASSGSGRLSIGSSIPTVFDIALKSTNLIINPNSTANTYTVGDPSEEYFIDVKSIRVAGETLALKDSYFSFDRNGVGGTKLSTVQNYTSLHNSIYKPLVRTFDKAAANLKIRSAAAVAPFRACYRSDSISRTAAGPVVPMIDLVLPGNDVYWRIAGANSMVEIDRETTCLAFVDAGSRPRTSVVIGVHQLEDNMLEFDVASLQLKFSSSLLAQNKSCNRV